VALYRDRGVVLRSVRLGEADRIVTILTAGRGKVRAVAKGIRRPRSHFGGRLEPMSHVAVQCFAGRSLDVVTEVEVFDAFRALRADLDRAARAAAMLEAVDQVAQEGHASPRLYRMLVGALRTLEATDAPLTLPAFFLKLLALEGSAPLLDACARCGAPGPLGSFDLLEGGALCRACGGGVAVGQAALELVRRILGGGLASALAEPRSRTTDEVAALATRALEAHLERRLRSLRVLDRA
jgi:DNA repair protein RecO (recombination protein O)